MYIHTMMNLQAIHTKQKTLSVSQVCWTQAHRSKNSLSIQLTDSLVGEKVNRYVIIRVS